MRTGRIIFSFIIWNERKLPKLSIYFFQFVYEFNLFLDIHNNFIFTSALALGVL